MSYIDDDKETQKIARETIEYLRELKEQKVSTGKIVAKVIERVREEWASNNAYLQNKLTEHDIEIKKQNSFLSKILRGLNGIVK